MTEPLAPAAMATKIEIHLCVPDDQQRHLPKRRLAPSRLPAQMPVPRQGDVIYLSSTSTWGVEMVIYQWTAPDQLRIEVWLSHVTSSLHARPSGFSLTQ